MATGSNEVPTETDELYMLRPLCKIAGGRLLRCLRDLKTARVVKKYSYRYLYSLVRTYKLDS